MSAINYWVWSATVTMQKVYTDRIQAPREYLESSHQAGPLRRALPGDRHRLFRGDWPEVRQGAEQLGHAPCLGNATSWSVRGISVTNLADLAQPKFRHALAERVEPLPGLLTRFIGMVMHTQVGFDKRPEQPRPHRPLMVRRVAGVSISAIMPYISRIRRSQCAQPEWSQQLTFQFPYDPRRPFHVKHGIVQTYGKDLVRAYRDVGSIASYNIQQAVLLGVPEFCVEAARGLARQGGVQLLVRQITECSRQAV